MPPAHQPHLAFGVPGDLAIADPAVTAMIAASSRSFGTWVDTWIVDECPVT